MNNNYSMSDVSKVDGLIFELFCNYSTDPNYLKETLREIRKLVDRGNTQADELVNKKRLEDFDAKNIINILQIEFPNLKWTSNQAGYGAVLFTGKVGVLEVRIDYDPSYTKKWDINTIDFYGDRCDTLSETVKVVKDYLLSIQSTLQQLNLT